MDLEADAPEEYCRQLETYLCRKNDGHLVRIVGPAFEQVCGWAARGVPLKVAFRGVDRYFERYYAKGPRRRPVRIEFCEADVLDVFDEWRRAVGVPARPAGEEEADSGETSGPRPHASLPAHLDRVIARLTALRGSEAAPSFDVALDAAVREIDGLRTSARGARGEARQAVVDRLRELDARLLSAATARCDEATTRQLASEAETELAPFRERMPREAYEQSRHAAIARLVRDRFRLPVLTYEG